MPAESAEDVASTGARAHKGAGGPRRRASAGPRMPSTAGYMAAAVIVAAAAFFGVGLALESHEDQAPWLMGALAAGAVLLVASALREIVMRRAWGRYTREMEFEMGRRGGGAHLSPRGVAGQRTGRVPSSVHASASALRRLQRRLSEADRAGALPEEHLEAYRLCEQYLADTEDAIRSAGGASDVRAALRAGQERVRTLQKGHLLAWARGEATRLTQEAKRRVRMSDKVETAQRALGVIEEALRLYPQEPELHQSASAVRDFVASVKVGHWVEMAERASFRGMHARAVSRYRDALFYLSRAEMSEGARSEAAERIQREIDLLRARMATGDGDGNGGAGSDAGGARFALDVEAVERGDDDGEEAKL